MPELQAAVGAPAAQLLGFATGNDRPRIERGRRELVRERGDGGRRAKRASSKTGHPSSQWTPASKVRGPDVVLRRSHAQ
jgi:hypothetical protein